MFLFGLFHWRCQLANSRQKYQYLTVVSHKVSIFAKDPVETGKFSTVQACQAKSEANEPVHLESGPTKGN